MTTDPSQATEAPSTRADSHAPASVVAEYLTAFYRGDLDRVGQVLAQGFAFEGPFLRVEGRDGFLAGAEGLRSIVRGHRLLHQWDDGTDVSSVYEVDLETPGGRGSVLMSEWHTVRDGQLVSGRVVFDTAAFRALVPQR